MASNNELRKQRYEFIDTAKGLLILLVVFGHAWRAVFNNNILCEKSLYHAVDSWIYSFHMPAFFFLAGIFALQSSCKPFREFVGGKLRTIAYPYLLWSLIQSILQLILSGSTTNSIEVKDILLIPFVPVMQYWFLYALFFIFIFFIILRQCTNQPAFFLSAGVFLFVFFRVGSVQSWLPINFVANNFIYFAAGIVFSPVLLSAPFRNLRRTDGLLLLMLITFILTAMIPMWKENLHMEIAAWLVPIFAAPGIYLSLLMVELLQRNAPFLAGLFALLGEKSLEIFVAHTIFSAGYRIVCLKLLGITSLGIHLFGAVIAGLVGPFILVYLANRLKFRHLFSYPAAES
nr:acyltransferase family protein [uncultured Desulfobulbus sp.]